MSKIPVSRQAREIMSISSRPQCEWGLRLRVELDSENAGRWNWHKLVIDWLSHERRKEPNKGF